MQFESPFLSDFSAIELQTDETKMISAIAGGKAIVIDFWTTKCVRCPAALSKLNDEAPKHDNAVFCSCVLDNKDVAADVVDCEWENMTHLFVESDTKESLKAQFQFSQVPFCIVADKDLKVLAAGNPKEINVGEVLLQLVSTAPGIPVSADGQLILDEDF